MDSLWESTLKSRSVAKQCDDTETQESFIQKALVCMESVIGRSKMFSLHSHLCCQTANIAVAVQRYIARSVASPPR